MRRPLFRTALIVFLVAEVAAWIAAVRLLGLLPVLAWTLATAAAGIFLLRRALFRILGTLRSRSVVAGGLGPGLLASRLLVPAVLLILPGLVTDFVALGLLARVLWKRWTRGSVLEWDVPRRFLFVGEPEDRDDRDDHERRVAEEHEGDQHRGEASR